MIVANPPFVVSPESQFLFRDSPLPADELSSMIVTEAADHLADGGFAHILCNWALTEGEEWPGPPRRWLAGTQCDALILHFGTEDPVAYAAMWNAPLRSGDPSAFVSAVDRWLDYYRLRGIHALCSGAVVLRRRASSDHHWVRPFSLRHLPEDPAGEDLLRLFRGQDWLEARGSDELLLDSVLQLLDRHEVRQTLTYRGGVYDSHGCTIVRTSGLGLEVAVDPEALQVVLRLDGRQTVREVARQVAAELGLDAPALLDKAAMAARELLGHGLILPGEGVDASSPSA